MHRPFLNAGFVGLLVIVMSILLMAVFPSTAPKLPDGFFTPIIAFEFMETKTEVYQLFGFPGTELREQMVSGMNLGNQLDYIYMGLYALFLMMFSAGCAKISGQRRYYTGICLALVVLAADIMENQQLFGITSKLSSGDFGDELTRLQLFTWLKWGGICIIFLLLASWFFRQNRFGKWIGGLCVASAVLGIAAFLYRSMAAEIFCLSVALVFLLMIVFSFTYKKQSA